MSRAACLALAALLLPGMAAAQTGPWVTNTDICAPLAAEGRITDAIGDALVLSPDRYEGLEYRCTFDPALDLGAADLTTTTHVGYCEEPGLITPQLFTFRIERLETPRVTLYTGAEDAVSFFACP
jgi:hypothetical protein